MHNDRRARQAVRQLPADHRGNPQRVGDGGPVAPRRPNEFLGHGREVHHAHLYLDQPRPPPRHERTAGRADSSLPAGGVDGPRRAGRAQREQEQDVAQQRIAGVQRPRVDVVKPRQAAERDAGGAPAAVADGQRCRSRDQARLGQTCGGGPGHESARAGEDREIGQERECPDQRHRSCGEPHESERCGRLGREPESCPSRPGACPSGPGACPPGPGTGHRRPRARSSV